MSMTGRGMILLVGSDSINPVIKQGLEILLTMSTAW